MQRFLLVAVLAMATVLPARAAGADIRGHWLSESADASIEIATCGDSLCGRVVWLRFPLDARGSARLDTRNPDAQLRHRPVLGLTILRDFDPASGRGGQWSGGTIYDPNDGKTYRSRLTLRDDGALAIRGYVGLTLFGRTTVWTRVGADEVAAWIADPATAPPVPAGARCEKR